MPVLFSAHKNMKSGTQLGHYTILAAIGKGGMGEVWHPRCPAQINVVLNWFEELTARVPTD